MTRRDTARSLAVLLREHGVADGLAPDALSVLTTKGISHDHWRIGATGLVLRIPRMSQWGLAADDQLAYEAAAFERAAACGHCPALRGVLPPGEALPRGALIVERVDGRPPRLPDELPAIADALVALHRLPLPGEADRAPLESHRDPGAATWRVIEQQAAYLPRARLTAEARAALDEELAWAAEFAARDHSHGPVCLVGTDTHPGNFLIDRAGKAWFVDLEKALYGAPAIDLAHATLAVSTGWDPDCAARLTPDQVAGFYRRYLGAVDRTRAAALQPSLLPLRRLTWLRTMTWLARWQAAWASGGHPASRDAAMTRHIARHVAASFTAEAIAAARADWLEPGRSPVPA